jgi:hypothetical protein
MSKFGHGNGNWSKMKDILYLNSKFIHIKITKELFLYLQDKAK